MKKRKRILPLFLAVLILVTILPVSAVASGHWADEVVDKLNAEYGAKTFTADDVLVTANAADSLFENSLGFDADQYFIDGDITRIQLCRALWDMSGRELPYEVDPVTFTDCPDEAVGSLAAYKIVSSLGDGSFNPYGAVTNAELAVMVYRTLIIMGGSVDVARAMLNGDLLPFSDLYGDEFYYDGVMYLRGNSIINGYPANNDFPNGRFGADGEVTFSEAVTLLSRCYGVVEENISGFEYNEAVEADYASLVAGAVYNQNYFSGYENYDEFIAEFQNVFQNDNWKIMYYDDHENADDTTNENCEATEEPHGHCTHEQGDPLYGSQYHPHLNWAAPYLWVSRECFPKDLLVSSSPDVQIYAKGQLLEEQLGTALSREQMALVAVHLYDGYEENEVNIDVLDRFNDGNEVGNDYAEAVAYFVSIGIINGDENGNINPQNTVTRGEIGIFIARVLQGLDSSKMHDYAVAVETVTATAP